jgi:hypothetical protein
LFSQSQWIKACGLTIAAQRDPADADEVPEPLRLIFDETEEIYGAAPSRRREDARGAITGHPEPGGVIAAP